MKNISIVTKLFLIASTLTSLLLVCTITYYLSVTETTAKLSRFRAVHVATAMELGELYAQGLQTEQALRNVLINPQDDKASANLGKALEDFDRLFAKTSDSAKGLQLHERLAATRVTWDKGVALKRQIHDLARQGNANAAQELLVKEETPAWRSFKDTILALSAESRNLMQSEAQSIDFKNRATLIMNLGIFSLTAVASMLLLFMFSRSLRTKLDFIIERARDMAAGEGDLTKRIHIDSRDELGQVADYFNQAWDKMDHMIAKVVEHATQIGTYAGQLAIESQRIVRNSRDMAGQSAAVATASEEMSATSNDIARNCTMAADSSQSAGDVAHNGKNVVQKTIDRMGSLKAEVQSSSTVIERLGRSSEQIGEIANTIQDIADQTNLLALNAAIEAARAGEQGRGFAVVADEVRALAARTARATGEIGAMIQAIQQESGQAVSAMHRSAGEVDLGVREAGESGEALVQITARVNEVAMQVSMIATAAEEQTATTSEIVQNISLISRSAEDFNASAANVNTKVQQLLELSDDLKQSISVFKIDASPLMILDTAKSDHVLFVNRIERCLEGAEKLQADQLADHTNCRFGKWYTDKGKELCGLSSSYRQINDPHERIHRLAREAVDLHNRGEHEQAERLVHQVEELSHEIVSLLDQVKTECQNHQIQH